MWYVMLCYVVIVLASRWHSPNVQLLCENHVVNQSAQNPTELNGAFSKALLSNASLIQDAHLRCHTCRDWKVFLPGGGLVC